MNVKNRRINEKLDKPERLQKATINISGDEDDDDDELLNMLYHMIKCERERGHSMQRPYRDAKDV